MPEPLAVQPELPFMDADLKEFFHGVACMGIEINGLVLREESEGVFKLNRVYEIAIPSWSKLGPL